MGLFQRVVPRPEVDEQVVSILRPAHLHSLGITGWQGSHRRRLCGRPRLLRRLPGADRRGLLTARSSALVAAGTGLDQLSGLAERREQEAAQGGFRATSVKIMQDGVCENSQPRC